MNVEHSANVEFHLIQESKNPNPKYYRLDAIGSTRRSMQFGMLRKFPFAINRKQPLAFNYFIRRVCVEFTIDERVRDL